GAVRPTGCAAPHRRGGRRAARGRRPGALWPARTARDGREEPERVPPPTAPPSASGEPHRWGPALQRAQGKEPLKAEWAGPGSERPPSWLPRWTAATGTPRPR